jgi:hypothetical protein
MRYQFKTRPYKHQLEGIRFAFKQFNQGLGAAFLFEPRTGKTKTTIDTAAILYYKRTGAEDPRDLPEPRDGYLGPGVPHALPARA